MRVCLCVSSILHTHTHTQRQTHTLERGFTFFTRSLADTSTLAYHYCVGVACFCVLVRVCTVGNTDGFDRFSFEQMAKTETASGVCTSIFFLKPNRIDWQTIENMFVDRGKQWGGNVSLANIFRRDSCSQFVGLT